ncbi:MAG TPA: S41 family peptidase [Thermoanaerobaculia bacterium]|nr:S41 family peptidase [Thermoanaerobaculia bacterium]
MRPLRLGLTTALLFAAVASGQVTNSDRFRGHTMVRSIRDEIRKFYYDPNFRGVDLDARFAAADKQVDAATSNSQIFAIIAQALLEFDDSHLFFLPPARAARVDYGWTYQAIGDKVYVTAVKPKSDAAAKGLKPGDQLLDLDGFNPTRAEAWKLRYLYHALRPRQAVQVVVQNPEGKQFKFDVAAAVTQGKTRVDMTSDNDFWSAVREQENERDLRSHRYTEVGDAFIWKMPQFDLDDHLVHEMIRKANKYKSLILDLRGNGGGSAETLQRLAGALLGDVKLGDLRKRKDEKPLNAKASASTKFSGPLVVLIDSESASSSEVLARVVQLEKRGTVIGDRSSGSVMESRFTTLQVGADTIVRYGLSVTDADLIMNDGKSLEHTGVTPDELLLPTAADLAAGRDPVLARAAKLVSVDLDPQKAGTLFPVEWRK